VTKRFTKKQEDVVVENRFGEVAHRIFYPLISQYDCKTKDLHLIGRDCLLLVELIRTLSLLTECCMNNRHQVIGMCGVLLEVVHSLRYHADVTVRRSLLYAISRVLLIDVKMQEDDQQTSIKGGAGAGKGRFRRTTMVEMYEWLRVMCTEDVDSVCREQAKVLLHSGWF
jgi:hypothetical protein